MLIVGSGLAGLLTAHFFRLEKPTVIEASPYPVDNHGALLRFRSLAIENITGAPLTQVRVRKAVMERDGSLSAASSLLHCNLYSEKVASCVSDRSIVDLTPVTRWIAGPDFLDRMRRGVTIEYGTEFFLPNAMGVLPGLEPIISTIPMPRLTDSLGLDPPPLFVARSVTTIECMLRNVDINQTVYVPFSGLTEELDAVYRVSFIGSRMVIEAMSPEDEFTMEEAQRMVNYFLEKILGSNRYRGQTTIRRQSRGKIVPLGRDERRSLIGEITRRWGIYSVGRYATWRNIILDDVVGDLAVVRNLIEAGSYGRSLHYAKGFEDA